ncbi:unnamed protein product, partial [Meganyctiphanes norvegica]
MCLMIIHIAGECFHFSEDELDWDTSQEACKDRGAQLAVPRDLIRFMEHVVKISDKSEYYFVGGYKDPQEGIWKWLNGESFTVGDNFWENDILRENNTSHCLAISHSKYKFYDQPCSHSNRYICQRPTEYLQFPLYVVGVIFLILVLLAIALSIFFNWKRNKFHAKFNISTDISDYSVRERTRHDCENIL